MKRIDSTDLEVIYADTFKSRLFGLMFTQKPPEKQAYFLEPCRSIHMFFMHYPLDVLVLNKDYEIIGIFKSLRPGKISPYFSKAKCFVEMSSGSVEAYGFELGQRIVITEA